VDGELNGVISISQLQVMATKLMPAPDAFTVTDRQRSSQNGYLIDPEKTRNYADLKQLKPNYAFVSKGIMNRFKRHLSPAQFGVGKGVPLGTITPPFTLFQPRSETQKSGSSKKSSDSQNQAKATANATPKPIGSQQSNPAAEANAAQQKFASEVLAQLHRVAQGQTSPSSSSNTSGNSGATLSNPRQIASNAGTETPAPGSTTETTKKTGDSTPTRTTPMQRRQAYLASLTPQQRARYIAQLEEDDDGPLGLFGTFDDLFG
jgi:hypothetical protein